MGRREGEVKSYHHAGVCRPALVYIGRLRASPRLAGTAGEQREVARIPNLPLGKMELQVCPEFLQCLHTPEVESRHPNPASTNGPSDLVPLACCYLLWLSP